MTEFTEWTAIDDTAATRKKYNQLAPALVAGLHFLMTVFAWGPSLTSMAVSARPIRGGTRPSAHNKGAALDIRYYTSPPAGSSRSFIDTEVRPAVLAELDILIENADRLGIQAIHDYYGDRIWRNNRDENEYPTGWKSQGGRGSGMGETWATYVHVEVNDSKWSDDTPWDQIILGENVADEAPRFNPEARLWGLWPYNANKPVVAVGSRGDIVRYVQGVLRCVAWVTRGAVASPGPIDGRCGAQTDRAIRSYQSRHGLTVDGRCGRNTFARLDADAELLKADQ